MCIAKYHLRANSLFSIHNLLIYLAFIASTMDTGSTVSILKRKWHVAVNCANYAFTKCITKQ